MDVFVRLRDVIGCLYNTLESYYIKRNIMAIPAADVVEVIRCKDCIHWNKKDVSGEYPDKIKCMCIVIKHMIPDGWTGYTSPDDYCSFAEQMNEQIEKS